MALNAARTKRVALVSCVAKKRDEPSTARELYTSPLFTKSFSFASKAAEYVHILSAHYGLVDPETVIAPYNVTLASFGRHDRRTWGVLIVESLCRRYAHASVEFTMLAGSLYVEPVRSVLEERRGRDGRVEGWTLLEPMKGLEIGERLKWLNEQLGVE